MKKQSNRPFVAVAVVIACLVMTLVVSMRVPAVQSTAPSGPSSDVASAAKSTPGEEPSEADPSEVEPSPKSKERGVTQREHDSAGNRAVDKEPTTAERIEEDGSDLDGEEAPAGDVNRAPEAAGTVAGATGSEEADKGDRDTGTHASTSEDASPSADIDAKKTSQSEEVGRPDDEPLDEGVSADDGVSEEPAEVIELGEEAGVRAFVMPEEAEYVPEEILLRVNPSASVEEVEALLASTPGIAPQAVDAEDLLTGLLAVALEPGTSVEDGVNAILGMGSEVVGGSQPNFVYHTEEDLSEADFRARLSAASEEALGIEGGQTPEVEATASDENEDDAPVDDADDSNSGASVDETSGASGEDDPELVVNDEVAVDAPEKDVLEDGVEAKGDDEASAAEPVVGVDVPDVEADVQDAEAATVEESATAGSEDVAEQSASLQERLAVSVNDYQASKQWALTSMRAYEAWAYAKCEGAVSVAVIDSGFNVAHRDLAANVVPGSAYNASAASIGEGNTSDVTPPVDSENKPNGHGMQVAGVVGAVANNGVDIAGVSYNARIVPIRVMDGGGTITTLAVRRAYDYVIEHADEWGIRVANFSIGAACDGKSLIEDSELSCCTREAFEHGIVTVAAAGNGRKKSDGSARELPYYNYPSDSRYVVGAIGLQKNDAASGNDASGTFGVSRTSSSETEGSNYNVANQGGPDVREGKNISAPGADVITIGYDDTCWRVWGTSFASPNVAGVVALEFAANPDLSADEAVDVLYASAHDIGDVGWDAEYGHGEVDAAAAVRMAKSGGVTTQLAGGGEVVMRPVVPEGGYEYDGAAKEPDVEVTFVDAEGSRTQLVRDVDFTVTYANNTDAGVATVTVTGVGTYEGAFARNVHFTIAGRALTGDMVSLIQTVRTYDARPIRPAVAVKDSGLVDADGQPCVLTLTEGIDYSCWAKDECNENVGPAIVHYTVTGLGNYTGQVTVTREFTIVPRDVSDGVTADVDQASFTYDGEAHEPDVTLTHKRSVKVNGEELYTLVDGTDYTLAYVGNVDVGTASVTVKGVGNYKGERTETFQIVSATLADGDVFLDAESYPWEGGAVTPEVTVIHDGRQLVEGTDFTVAYFDNERVGTAIAVVTGIGNYEGTATATYRIAEDMLDEAVVDVVGTHTYTYTGSPITPKVTVSHRGAVLEEGVDYELEFADNTNAGTATIMVTGKGNFGGCATAEFSILPKQIAVPAGTNYTYNREVQVGVAQGDGYELSGTTEATNAGSYDAYATPDDNHCWADGSTGMTAIEWEIAKALSSVSIVAQEKTYTGEPLAYSGKLTRSGSSGQVTYAYYSDAQCTKDVAAPKAVGTYWVKATLAADANYAEETSEAAEFSILRKQIAVPEAATPTYNGWSQVGVAAGTGYTLSGTTRSTAAGTYVAYATLDANHCWDGGSTARKTISWKIAKAPSSVSIAAQTKTYTGDSLAYSGKVTRSGSSGQVTYRYYSDQACTKAVATANVKAVGTYWVKATLAADANYAEKTSAAAEFSILRKQVAVPKAATPTYNGRSQVGVAAGTGYTLSGITRSTAAGSYVAYATPDANHCWTGGSTTRKTINWKIDKAASSVSIVAQTKTYTGKTIAYSGKVTRSGSTGKVTYKYYSDKTCKKAVTAPKAAGTYWVKATLAADANYATKMSAAAKLTVAKAANPLTVKAVARTASAKTLKSKSVTVTRPMSVSKAQGKVTYKKVSGDAYLTINKSTGKATVKKGAKKGKHTIKVKVTAAGSANYKAGSKTITCKVTVK